MSRQPYRASPADHAAEFAAFMRLNGRVTTLRPESLPPAPRRPTIEAFFRTMSQVDDIIEQRMLKRLHDLHPEWYREPKS